MSFPNIPSDLDTAMAPNPKHLILNLLMAADGPLTSREAVGACALFGIRENSVRVALVRLAAAGLVEAAGRGSYRLGPQAAPLADDVSRWRTLEQRACEWDGRWLVVSTGALGRSDRPALRARERALTMAGFRELEPTLYLRPDNLVGHAPVVRERLYKLGLDSSAPVFSAHDLDKGREQAARHLWDGPALTASYQATRQKLQRWMAHADQLDTDVAARECYLLGNEAIRQLVFDPLLPEPLVDVAERRAFNEAVQAYDRAGHVIWQKLLAHLLTRGRANTSLTDDAATSPPGERPH